MELNSEENNCSTIAPETSSDIHLTFERAVLSFLSDRKCPTPLGPAKALFSTLAPGGAQQALYCYGILTEGGWTPGGFGNRAAISGRGCSTYEELERTFISLLDQHTKPDFPVVIRKGPQVEQRDGRWFGYFRFVQLDFQACEMLVTWDLN